MQEVANATQSGYSVDLSSFEAAFLVVIVILGCMFCLYMVFFFVRKVQGSAQIRTNIVRVYTEYELKELERELLERAINRPLDPTDLPPDFFGCHSQLWEPHLVDSYQALYGQPKAGETPDEKKEREAKLQQCKAWELRERERYAKLKSGLQEKAKKIAEESTPMQWDALSFLGGGHIFLLEFSTVIVIIFSILALGILRILEGQDIATILAAIAGYVLGRATSGRSEGGTETKK